MNCQFHLLVLIFCGFAALTVSAQACGKDQLEGTSCTIEVTKSKEKLEDIRWTFTSSDGPVADWRNDRKRKPPAGITIHEDGSLRFDSVCQSYTGTYKFMGYNGYGQQIGTKELEMKVHAKAPKPNMKINCTTDGSVTLFCDAGNNKDLTITWYEDDDIMNDERNPHLSLTSVKVKENKQYTCSVSNPVSSGQSDRTTLSCLGTNFVDEEN